jgi:hypothetical protein
MFFDMDLLSSLFSPRLLSQGFYSHYRGKSRKRGRRKINPSWNIKHHKNRG